MNALDQSRDEKKTMAMTKNIVRNDACPNVRGSEELCQDHVTVSPAKKITSNATIQAIRKNIIHFSNAVGDGVVAAGAMYFVAGSVSLFIRLLAVLIALIHFIKIVDALSMPMMTSVANWIAANRPEKNQSIPDPNASTSERNS